MTDAAAATAAPPPIPTTKDVPFVVVGIDVGTESTRAVLGKNHDHELVRTSHGGHSTPTSITFRDKVRLIGEEASEPKNADGNTVLHVNRLLPGGRGVGEEGDVLGEFYRFDVSSSSAAGAEGKEEDGDGGEEAGGTSVVAVSYDGNPSRSFSSSALLAMLLGNLKKSVDSTVERKVGDAATARLRRRRYVLVVPPGSSPAAKSAVRDAVYAAGIGGGGGVDDDEVRVVSSAECVAAAYGRKFFRDVVGAGGGKEGTSNGASSASGGDEEEANGSGGGRGKGGGRVALVVDMGHSWTTASVLRLGSGGTTDDDDEAGEAEGSNGDADETKDANATRDGKKVSAAAGGAATILSTSSDPTLGAGNVDAKLWRHFRSTLPILSSLEAKSRGGSRLLAGCRKLKHQLSMLPSGSVAVEGLGGDEHGDVILSADRETLRRICQSEADALARLVEKVLDEAAGGIDGGAVDSVEAMGGGCRIPFVQDVVRAAAKLPEDRPLSKSLDDTVVALGAAMIGDEGPNGAFGSDAMDVDGDDERDRRRRDELREAERAMADLDDEMNRRSEARNRIEAHVLKMRAAKHEKHGSLLPKDGTLDAHLDAADDWIFSEECDGATLQEMEDKLSEIERKTDELCEEYFRAVKEEAEEKERRMEEEAAKAKAEREAEGGDGDDDDHDNRRLPKKRRMEIVTKNKAEAAELFKDGNYRHAAARYAKALSHCGKFYDLGPDDKAEVDAVKLSLHLNMALCYIKLEKYDNALRSCNDALDIDGDNAKGLFRRATVYYEKKKWADAAEDVAKAEGLAPEDKAIKKLKGRVEQQLKRQKAKEKKMAQKMFG